MEDKTLALTAQAQIWKFIYGFADTLVLRCGIELGIADIIHKHGQPISLAELASKINPVKPINLDRLHRIMRYLVHINIFSSQQINSDLRYGLKPQATFLITSSDKCLVPAILAITDKDFMAPWHFLKEGLVDGSTAFEKALGKNIWDYMAANPEKNKLFNEAMACDSRILTSALIRDCREMFEGIGSLVDIGGGTGTALRAIARAFPHIDCTVFDLPHVIADSPDYPEVSRVEGDMFKLIPKADAIVMKCILHDWDDENCVKILKKCKEAVPLQGGKVIIVDIVLGFDPNSPYKHMKQCMDLDMMINCGGKERTEEEWKKLIYDAGFAGYKIKNISAIQSVIEAYPH